MMKRFLTIIMITWPLSIMLSFSSEIVIFQNGKYLEIESHEEYSDQYRLILKGGEVSCAKSVVIEIRKSHSREIVKSQEKIKNIEVKEDYRKIVDEISGKYDIDPSLVKAIIKVESNFNPNAVSSKGAKGLMQLMPETADRFQAKDVFNVHENIEAGIKYLKFLFEKYNDRLDLVLAAYNAGEKVVDQYDGIPPYQETVDYVLKVCDIYGTM